MSPPLRPSIVTPGTQNFARLSLETPLPWREHPDNPRMIVDAEGKKVCEFDSDSTLSLDPVGMILVAVNTCGGFKYESPPVMKSPR